MHVSRVDILHIDKSWHDNSLPKINYVTKPQISKPIFFFNKAKDFAIFYFNCLLSTLKKDWLIW